MQDKSRYNIDVYSGPEQQVLIDGGVKTAGGWLAAKSIMELLLEGRALVQFGELQFGQHRKVTLDIYWDSLPKQWRDVDLGQDRQITLIGGNEQSPPELAFLSSPGLPELSVLPDIAGKSRLIIVASPTSLIHNIFMAAKALHANINRLPGTELKDGFLWGWGSCPISSALLLAEQYARYGAVSSFWFNATEEAISRAAGSFSGDGEIRFHSFGSGRTYTAGGLEVSRLTS